MNLLEKQEIPECFTISCWELGYSALTIELFILVEDTRVVRQINLNKDLQEGTVYLHALYINITQSVYYISQYLQSASYLVIWPVQLQEKKKQNYMVQHKNILSETLSLTNKKLRRQEKCMALPKKYTVLALSVTKSLSNFSQMKSCISGI